MKKFLKNNKGITLTALIVTIILMLILTSTVMIKVKDTSMVSKLNNLYSDIKLLEDKVLDYYNDYGTLPIKGEQIELQPDEINGKCYEIDLSKLENLTLNYGEGTYEEDKDIYVVDKETLDIYYLKGIEYSDNTYYTYKYTLEN